ncbi:MULTISPECIES: ROK family protein [Caproicibacterium]|jgi:glucokinase|uniref:ROK family protein n=1 Tax=Caproicibacterium lactatifermentans TaxID=2666138 RepID=A0A859DQ95_9FIRM|nr:ROK family protein [Caproicibacterium lactatifermentans]ARP50651.1 glucokinase [Ruminococcaceae bacterium CPB6]MDD4807424.1 ROK family protein [Oscillospiraceae bacterium]QKN23615.1 ROK family protein [Caproicibacterium lactatifermentans]QKO29711.1 ROK family protein [Caproicibacterium lactatifermentans]
MYYLGIDLGGTNIAVGIIDENYKMVASAKSHTRVPCPEEELTEQLANTALQALRAAHLTLEDVPWIGVGSPGSIDSMHGIVGFSGNLNLHNYPLANQLSQRLNGRRVLLENDANAAAFGEYKAGALQNAANALAITLGTGIGGGILIDGKIYSGCNGAAGELGHQVIKADGRSCTCGRHGCWETYASATGLIRTTQEIMQTSSDHSSPIWQLAGNDLNKVSGRTAFDAMRAGDPLGQKAVDCFIRDLGTGLVNCINIFQPDRVCIGGGICNEKDYLLKPLQAFVNKETFLVPNGPHTQLCIAQLGNDAGIIGAALLGTA